MPIVPLTKTKPIDERYLTKTQLCERWQCSRRLIEKFVRLGMPREPFGGAWRYNLAECDAWRRAYYEAVAEEQAEQRRKSGGLHPVTSPTEQ